MEDASSAELLKTDYERLYNAVGALPEPIQLCREIISECRIVVSMKRSLLALSNSVNNLCNSVLSHSELVQRHQYLKLTLEKLELRFLLTRTHLREAWRYPPLLFATGAIQPFEWDRLWETTLQDDLVVNPREVEEQISDALDTIGVDLTRLYDLYEDITASDQQQQTYFRHDVLKSLREITARLPKENTSDNNLPAGEGDQDAQDARAREREAIQRNASFMEPIAGLNENENEEPLRVVDAAVGDDHDKEESPRPVVVIPPRRRESPDEITRLQQHLRDAQQTERRYRRMIEELERRERCRPRRLEEGRIHNVDEDSMPCVFCGVRGEHYSDSCQVYPTGQRRLELIQESGRCTLCLDRYCYRDPRCRKYYTSCRYCKLYGHNSALCSLPDESQRIEEQLERLRIRREEAARLVLRVIRRLRRRGVEPEV